MNVQPFRIGQNTTIQELKVNAQLHSFVHLEFLSKKIQAKDVSKYVFHSGLRSLKLNCHNIQEEILPEIKKALYNREGLEYLFIRKQLESKISPGLLIHRSKVSESLINLHLNFFKATERAWKFFFKALETNSVLKKLKLWCSKVKDINLFVCVKASLQCLVLDVTVSSYSSLQQLARSIQQQQIKVQRASILMPMSLCLASSTDNAIDLNKIFCSAFEKNPALTCVSPETLRRTSLQIYEPLRAEYMQNVMKSITKRF